MKYGVRRANAELRQKIETDPFAVDLRALDLSPQINQMLKSAGVATVGDLLELDLKEFKYIKFIGEKNRSRIIQKLKAIGYNYVPEDRVYMSNYRDAETVPKSNISLDHLNLSTRTYNALRRWGLKKAKDILDLDIERFTEISYLGDKGRAETILKLEELGYDCCHLTPNKTSKN